MSAYFKTVIRTIKGSITRFIAIFAIIALGVGFFAGLKVTMPSFLETGNDYYMNYKFFDFRLVSTIGFSEDDIKQIQKLDGVKAATGAVFQDLVVSSDGQTRQTVRIHSITTGVNELKLDYGRLPQAPNEVVADGYRLGPETIGQKITITPDNKQSSIDALKSSELEIVGIIRSPLYLNFQRGTTDAGKGTIDYYLYIPEEGFDFEYYTEAYVWYDTGYEIYSDEYKAFAETKEKELEDDISKIIEDRFDEALSDSYKDIDDAIDEFEEARIDAVAELVDGQKELDDARKELLDAKKELNDAKKKLDDGQKKIDDGQKELSEAKKKIDSGEKELKENLALLNDSKTKLTDGIKTAKSTESELKSKRTELLASKELIENSIEELKSQQGVIPDDIYEAQMSELSTKLGQINAGIEQVEAGLQTVSDTLTDLNSKLEQVNAGFEKAGEGAKEIKKAKEEYENGKKSLDKAKKEYNDGLKKYEDGLKEYEDGQKEFMDGLIEYQEGKNKFYREMGKASASIDLAIRTIEQVEKPDTYVLGRDKNVGYVCFETDSQIVDGVASVFPLFFFAIAALVCSTTMSRMVADERVQIGSMRALGYSEFAIVMKYVIYSGSASVLGCVLGFLGGTRLFPYVIWSVYNVMYGFAPIIFRSSLPIFLISLTVSLLCSVGVTVLTCAGELKGTPAQLVRPKAPAPGKRILLERIPFIWKRMKFLHKVSARNVFRFKKRMFMMILGISGCTSLLLTGFGLRDSINDIVNIHYDNIMKYEISFTFDDDVNRQGITDALKDAKSHFSLTDDEMDYALARIENAKHTAGGTIRDVQVFISDDPNITSIIGIRDEKTQETYSWPGDNEIAISSKLAKKNNIKAGDMITLSHGDNGEEYQVKVAYVFENYIFHYAFMNKATYESCYGKSFEPAVALASYKETAKASQYDIANYVSDNNDVISWSVNSDMRQNFSETMKQLNAVVVLIIGCAASLAFIVLFNLNNINITERIREIATLKVMGFNRSETGVYVSRENIFLVVIGFIFGIPLGIALHAFVISQIEMDTVTFVVQILPWSYVFSLLFVILFSLIVDFIMRRKIDRIHMAESLKSIE